MTTHPIPYLLGQVSFWQMKFFVKINVDYPIPSQHPPIVTQ